MAVVEFVVLVSSLIGMGVVAFMMRFLVLKVYGMSSRHAKALPVSSPDNSSSCFKITPHVCATDVDELENLDNLKFTVRTHEHNLRDDVSRLLHY
jgi:Na+-transporting methylmalonyl-CoA/oxaloacetate decarboxylase gamma subunit